MNSLLLTLVSLISGILGVISLIAFFVTGKKNAALRVAGGILVIICVVTNFIS